MCNGAPCGQCTIFSASNPSGAAPKGEFWINTVTGCLWVMSPTGWIQLSCPSWATTDLIFRFDGGGSAIQNTIKPIYIPVDFACTLIQCTTLADQSGTITVELVACSFANFDAGATHPVYPGDDITGGAPPALAAATKQLINPLTGWSPNIAAGTVIGAIIPNNATNITALTLALKAVKA
jgi:hypothetical protein